MPLRHVGLSIGRCRLQPAVRPVLCNVHSSVPRFAQKVSRVLLGAHPCCAPLRLPPLLLPLLQVLQFFTFMGMPHPYKAPLLLVEGSVLDYHAGQLASRATAVQQQRALGGGQVFAVLRAGQEGEV